MALNQINLTEEAQKVLSRVSSIVSDKPMKTTPDRVNESLRLLGILIRDLDEQSFLNLTNYSNK